MILAELNFETGSIIGASYMILAAMGYVAFRLGSYTTKVDSLAVQREKDRIEDREERKELKADLARIFERLEVLSQRPPHMCIQMDHVTELKSEISATKATLIEHSARMDRIQQGIHDKETA